MSATWNSNEIYKTCILYAEIVRVYKKCCLAIIYFVFVAECFKLQVKWNTTDCRQGHQHRDHRSQSDTWQLRL